MVIIRLGDHDRAKKNLRYKYIERRASRIILHPRFMGRTPVLFDIALIKMERPVRLFPHISPICLPRSKSSSKGLAIVTGWGNTEELKQSSILKK